MLPHLQLLGLQFLFVAVFFDMYAMNFLKDKSFKFGDLLNSSLFSYFASSMISSSKNANYWLLKDSIILERN
jgi:hypothetical protein